MAAQGAIVDYESHKQRQEETRKKLGELTDGYEKLSHDMSLDSLTQGSALSYLSSAISPSSGLGLRQRARHVFLASQTALYKVPVAGKYLVIKRPVSMLLEEGLERVKGYGDALQQYYETLEELSQDLEGSLGELNTRAVDVSKEISNLEDIVTAKISEIDDLENKYKGIEDKRSPQALKLRSEIDEKKRASRQNGYDLNGYKDALIRATNLSETNRVLIDAIEILSPEISTLYQRVLDWVQEGERTIRAEAQLTRATELVTGTAVSVETLRKEYNQIFAYNIRVISTIAGRVGDLVSGELTDPEVLESARKELQKARIQQEQSFRALPAPAGRVGAHDQDVIDVDFKPES